MHGLTDVLWTPWAPGPDEESEGPVLVSLTSFQLHSLWDAPAAVRAALRLRSGWYGISGAVGMCLWASLPRRRSGAVSVWASTEDMRRWAALPLHRRIMSHYGPRGELETTTWELASLGREAVLAEAERRLAAGALS